jgi:hypothetical protein
VLRGLDPTLSARLQPYAAVLHANGKPHRIVRDFDAGDDAPVGGLLPTDMRFTRTEGRGPSRRSTTGTLPIARRPAATMHTPRSTSPSG